MTNEQPFTTRSVAPAPHFVGRDRELDIVFGHLRPPLRGNVAVNGPLGSGKSSLLRMVDDPEIAEHYGISPPAIHTCFLDVQSISPFSGHRFWRRVARLLQREDDAVFSEHAAKIFDAGPRLDVIDIEEFLDGLADEGIGLVLLLDEFEWALHADDPDEARACRDFLAQLASLARRTPRTLSLVVATERPLSEALQAVDSWRGSPFSTIFTSITLKPLTRDEVARLVQRSNDGLGPGDIELLWDLSSGHPAVVQAVAAAIRDTRIRSEGGEDDLAEAARAAAERMRRSLARPRTEGSSADGGAGDPGSEAARGLRIDERTGEVLIDGDAVEALTALEYSLLRLLHGQPGRLCSKDEIIREVWGEEAAADVDDSRVEKLVSRLRHKIEAVPGRPRFIRTVRGRGYRFVPDES